MNWSRLHFITGFGHFPHHWFGRILITLQFLYPPQLHLSFLSIILFVSRSLQKIQFYFLELFLVKVNILGIILTILIKLSKVTLLPFRLNIQIIDYLLHALLLVFGDW